MIKKYKNGQEFITENLRLLQLNKYFSLYLINNSNVLQECDNKNYALKSEIGDKKLIIIKCDPYGAIFYGDEECLEEAIDYILTEKLEIKNFLSLYELGNSIKNIFAEKYKIKFKLGLAFDFMDSKQITEPSCNEVEHTNFDDIDELYDCLGNFIKDVGLDNEVSLEKLKSNIDKYRVIRDGDKIISMAKYGDFSDEICKISDVYTRVEYRGKSYARKVVNTLKNEIIKNGKIAVLNVDKKNPISNHLYSSIGFEKIFSQVEFRRED